MNLWRWWVFTGPKESWRSVNQSHQLPCPKLATWFRDRCGVHILTERLVWFSFLTLSLGLTSSTQGVSHPPLPPHLHHAHQSIFSYDHSRKPLESLTSLTPNAHWRQLVESLFQRSPATALLLPLSMTYHLAWMASLPPAWTPQFMVLRLPHLLSLHAASRPQQSTGYLYQFTQPRSTGKISKPASGFHQDKA